MLPFESFSPTRLIMSPQAELEAAKMIRLYGGSRVLVHFGSGSVIKSGLLDRVRQVLSENNLFWIELGGVVPNPRETLVYQGIDICRQESLDYVLAVGGGSVLDSAKAISIGALFDGDFWDFYGKGATPEKRLGLGTIITLPATGSEASNSSVIKNDSLDLKRGLRSDLNRPDFSLINPTLTYTLPRYQIACGAADIAAHVMERYFTRTTGVGLTDRMCEAVMKSVFEETPKALADPCQYDVQANLFYASTIAHIGWLGAGRVEDWSTHGIEHELSGHFDTAHGAGLAAMFPAWINYMISKDEALIPRLAQFATRVMGVEMDFSNPADTVRLGADRLSKMYISWGLPANLKELGIPKERLSEIAGKVKRKPDGTIGALLPLREDDLPALLNLAWDWH
jgi:alcohol dehydrogenase YqhD (iron-dependent ADH family)